MRLILSKRLRNSLDKNITYCLENAIFEIFRYSDEPNFNRDSKFLKTTHVVTLVKSKEKPL